MRHIRSTGLYPPIVVRSLHHSQEFPSSNGNLQIIDGHLRYQILKELGYDKVEVRNFGPLGDDQAEILLLTLNHLKSPCDPKKRAALIKHHQATTKNTLDQLVKLLPDSKLTLLRLLSLEKPQLQSPPKNLPKPFAVYLSQSQHDLVRQALAAVKKQNAAPSVAHALEIMAKKWMGKK